MTALLVETANVQEAAAAEAAAPPGLYEVVLTDIQPFTQADVAALRDYFVANGVDVKAVRYQVRGLHQLRIQYVHHAPADSISQGALLIPLIPMMLLATLVGIAIFRIEAVTTSVAKVVLVAGGIAIALALILRQPTREVATEYVRRK